MGWTALQATSHGTGPGLTLAHILNSYHLSKVCKPLVLVEQRLAQLQDE